MMKFPVGRVALMVGLAATGVGAAAQKPYHVVDRWVIGGEGGWDYLTSDSVRHRLYVTHTTNVEVVDTRTGRVVGEVTG